MDVSRRHSSFIRQRRIAYIALGIMVSLLILCFRLAWIQGTAGIHLSLYGGHSLKEMSVRQRQEGIAIDTGRGQFTDRHGQPLTGGVVWTPVLFPDVDGRAASHGQELAKLLHTSKGQLLTQWKGLQSPLIWRDGRGEPVQIHPNEAGRLLKLAPSLIELVPYAQRYRDLPNGRQWLGFMYERGERASELPMGAAGLERTLEPLLSGVGETFVSRFVDAQRRPLTHVPLRVSAPSNSHYPLQVKTTIDLPLQEQIEKLTESNHLAEGAVVVLDAGNADVMAMVSRPFYNPAHVDPQQKTDWSNRALKAVTPGSIFKLVTAAAALESGVVQPQEQFHCHGAYGKYGLSCWKKEGHGTLNLEEGLAVSCNSVFAHLGERLNAEQIQAVASALGLSRTVGWQDRDLAGLPQFRPMDHEEKGAVFGSHTNASDPGVRVQTAIGQRDVLVTPLQAANLIVTLLHDGQVHAPRIVKRVSYADGSTLLELPAHAAPLPQGSRSIRTSTAHTLREAMEQVVTHGTGASLRNKTWKLAGKSGTAQALKNGRPINHQWFIGYGPIERPRYAVAVLVQNASTHAANQATALFGQVMDLLAQSS
ncbi:penicillin-binding protein 2 [Paenibacillus sp. P2(2022)]|uniref:peptidoglycan D,D-transpeptidase FtsI family protein n=1 Tax=Paenibacillus TaxID=44249 RepID=UPI0005ED10D1|nr:MULTISPECIES: penicillin-binding transpeptidase domain-containing protein [Paenibacillus]KJK31115.1 penicillin-binding protein [Paenibacillus polymyxa]MDG0052106.1 penicillin-binding protein 2 [Paenibacillus sp. P2(2022)]MEE4562637.1 penicillin-binding transpeptidase domain-containing protein [Paenibacillus polymyxa]